MKSPPHTHTLEAHKHPQPPPMKSSTTHKIPYLPLIGFKFQDVIFNRLNSQNEEPPKSIFFLKGNFKKDNTRNKEKNVNSLTQKRYRAKNQLPQVSLSTTLESRSKSEKRNNSKLDYDQDDLIKKEPKSVHMYTTKPSLIHTYCPLQMSSTKGQHKPKIHKSQHEKKANKQECKLDDMIVGNKTILNFRSVHNQNKKYDEMGTTGSLKKNISQHKTKIKFGTFLLAAGQQLCPWGFMDRYDDHL